MALDEMVPLAQAVCEPATDTSDIRGKATDRTGQDVSMSSFGAKYLQCSFAFRLLAAGGLPSLFPRWSRQTVAAYRHPLRAQSGPT